MFPLLAALGFQASQSVGAAAAQSSLATQSELEAAPASTLLDWTTVEILVGADSARGIYVKAYSKKTVGLMPAQSTAGTRYAPVAVRAWLPSADSVFQAPEPDSADSRVSVQTRFLRGRTGSVIMFGRLRAGPNHWDPSPILYFAGPDGRQQVAIRGDTGLARSFLQALERAAAASDTAGGGGRTKAERACDRYAYDDAALTAIREAQPREIPPPRYPLPLQRAGIEGLVDVRFVVLPTGRADPRSFDVVFASHPRFVAPVLESLSEAAFEPAWRDGAPIPSCVQQGIRFGMRR